MFFFLCFLLHEDLNILRSSRLGFRHQYSGNGWSEAKALLHVSKFSGIRRRVDGDTVNGGTIGDFNIGKIRQKFGFVIDDIVGEGITKGLHPEYTDLTHCQAKSGNCIRISDVTKNNQFPKIDQKNG